MNITLIGMSGVGKTTVGHELAQLLQFSFLDIDQAIETDYQKTLPQIIAEFGTDAFNQIEETYILNIHTTNTQNTIISPGGSVIYKPKAMQQLQTISQIIFLYQEPNILKQRIHNINERGILGIEHGFEVEYKKRLPLYQQYANFTYQMPVVFEQKKIAQEISKLVF
jgi:shikimate kinase